MALVPNLRFPEFRAANEWTPAQLTDTLLSISNGLSLSQTNQITPFRVTRIETIADWTIDLCRIGYVDPTEDISDYKLNVGDILFSNINSVTHIGKNVIVNADMDLYHGMNLLRLVPNYSAVSPQFLFYLLNTEPLRTSFKARANKAVNQASINQTEVGKTNIYLPELPEQRKIAECLSSLDELIAAERQKLDALKAHKNGLMQQLFPAEGETVPRLRFPEFHDADKWETKCISDLGRIVTGSTPSTAIPEFYGGERLFVSPADISDERFIGLTHTTLTDLGFRQTRPIPPNSILFVCIGSIGKVAQNLVDCASNQQINAVIPNTKHCAAFLYYTLTQVAPQMAALAGRHVVPIINKTAFGNVEVILPKKAEQERIAECLSSLDESIAAQTLQIEALRAQKTGLMQQLFPSLDEVQA